MVWVAGRGAPSVMHQDIDAALASAERLRREFTGREVFVLAPVARIDGRPLTEIREAMSPRRQPVAAPVVSVKRRRHTVSSSACCKTSILDT